MTTHCQVTGAAPGSGRSISRSHRRTPRRFRPNLQRRSFYVPSLGRRVTLTLSARGIRTVDAHGIESVVARMRARGEKF